MYTEYSDGFGIFYHCTTLRRSAFTKRIVINADFTCYTVHVPHPDAKKLHVGLEVKL